MEMNTGHWVGLGRLGVRVDSSADDFGADDDGWEQRHRMEEQSRNPDYLYVAEKWENFRFR